MIVLTMLNECVDYAKRSFRSCHHDRVVFVLNDEKKVSNLNDHADHAKLLC